MGEAADFLDFYEGLQPIALPTCLNQIQQVGPTRETRLALVEVQTANWCGRLGTNLHEFHCYTLRYVAISSDCGSTMIILL